MSVLPNTKWMPRELRRELSAIAKSTFKSMGRSKSSRAKLVQEWLYRANHRLDIDGDFGPAAEQVVQEFRAARGLTVANPAPLHRRMLRRFWRL